MSNISNAATVKIQSGTKTRKSKLKGITNNLDLYLVLLIPLAILIIFRYIPMLGLVISFQDFNPFDGIWNSPFVGLKHFHELFSGGQFLVALKNTLWINLLRLVFQFPVPLIMALMINEVTNMKAKRLVQTATYLPHFLSWVVVSAVFIDLLNPSSGIVNSVISSLGFHPISFLSDEKYFRSVIVLSATWKEAGWGSIMYLSAITAINTEMYEAAKVDGAGRFKQMWYITIPSISSTIIFLFLMRIAGALGSDVDQFLVMCSPVVYNVGDVLGTYIYRMGIQQGNYSYTTAAGLFQSAVGFVLLYVANFTTKKRLGMSMW